MSHNRSFEEILQSAEHHHTQYVKQLRLLHDAAYPTDRFNNSPRPSPTLRADTFPGDPSPSLGHGASFKQSQRLANESGAGYADKIARPLSLSEGAAADSGDDVEFLPLTSPIPIRYTESRVAVDETCRPQGVSGYLDKEWFSEEQLAAHLNSLNDEDDGRPSPTAIALGSDLWQRQGAINTSTVSEIFVSEDAYPSATYEVYEVSREGLFRIPYDRSPLIHDAPENNLLNAPVMWDTIRNVNPKGDAIGRMTILQEPSPLVLGAVHMTLKKHFDMDELFQHLVSTDGNKGKTRAYLDRTYETMPLRQRSFFFIFKYYTIVEDGLTPASWQAYDTREPASKSPDHINIAECSSVLALSLGGDPTKTVQKQVRRKVKGGKVFDTFAPWHMVNIQFFPDEEHSVRSSDFRQKTPCNGPHAFLNSLSVEYRDAAKRYAKLNQHITKLITPLNQFMFDGRLRDKLLFEDKDFTYSRRYFWAYNTLGVINDGIKSMRSAYLDTFNKDFWAGKHKTLWPHPAPDSAEGHEYVSRLEAARQDLEAAVRDLEDVYDRNARTRDEIRSLREQLFSGSSVKESRRAIEQGHNIKILTSVSMIFLPLTFVTSVFGITEFQFSERDWRFAVTMVSVCIPFFLLIIVLQTQATMQAVRKYRQAVQRYISASLQRRFQRCQQPSGGPLPTPTQVQGNEGGHMFWQRKERVRMGWLRRWMRGRGQNEIEGRLRADDLV